MVGGHEWQGACVVGGMHGRGCAWWGHAWQRGIHSRGVCMAGDMHGMHIPPGTMIYAQSMHRSVCILLECILVFVSKYRRYFHVPSV